MTRPRATSELLIGFALSCALHGTLVVGIMRARIPTGVLYASFLAEPSDPTRLETDPIPLGLDVSSAATATWIGFEEFEEQRALPAEIDQGAFTTNPGPLSTGEAPGAPVPVAPPPEEPRRAVDLQPELRTLLEAPPQGTDPTPPRTGEEPTPEPAAPDESPDGPPAPDEPPQPQPPVPAPDPIPVPVQPVPAAPPAPAPGGEPGQPSDQESDPASAIEVTMEQLTLGRPLAAQGLQIKPRKPVFTTLMLLTAAPENPTAELRFRRSGEPVRVKLLVSSGDGRIDEAVINALYKWRASGRRLADLREGQTVPVRIRILLH
jgi:outer membrane biosynthesis protein TonB